MKKIVICAFLFAAFSKNASAQSNSTSGNSEEQPKWKPAGQEHAEYYYLPDIDTYYYVPRKQFIYQSGGYWTFSTSLPEANKNYDLYAANKVVINEAGAYRYFDQHKIKYGSSQTNASAQKEQPGIKKSTEKKSG